MLSVQGLHKTYKLYKRPSDRFKEWIFRKPFFHPHTALSDISFELSAGETLGVIGQNGAGKSTLLKILSGVILPDDGKITAGGRITGLLELGTGFNSELSGEENILLNGLLIGMTKTEILTKKKEIIAFSELDDFINEPIRIYSSGMIMRLAFSIAIHSEPDCFLIDEALSVGDASFQQKCFDRLKDFKKKGGSILFVSHDMNAVKILCDKAIFLHHGKIGKYSTPEEVVNEYNYYLSMNQKAIQKNAIDTSYGNGEVLVKKIKLYGQMSKGSIITSGEKTHIEVNISSLVHANDVNIGFLIRNQYGQDIYGTNSHHLEQSFTIYPNTEYLLSFIIDMNFAPGKYTVTIALHSGATHSKDCFYWHDRCLEFQIAGYSKYTFAGIAQSPTQFSYEKL